MQWQDKLQFHTLIRSDPVHAVEQLLFDALPHLLCVSRMIHQSIDIMSEACFTVT